VLKAIEARDGASIRELAHKIAAAGADVIDVNIGTITSGADEVMPWLVDEIQAVADIQLSLDAHTAEAIIAGAERAARKPILNAYYVQSATPGDVLDKLVPYAVEHGLELILPLLEGGEPPLDPTERAARADDLIRRVGDAGLAQEHLYLDPVVYHLAGGDAQAHAASVLETLRLLPLMYEPAVKTVVGANYLSLGSPLELRSPLSRTFMAMAAANGLDAAMVDVLDREVLRDIRLIRALRNESLYSVSDAEVK
jgi:cobalamin-dependent methionine synthase I